MPNIRAIDVMGAARTILEDGSAVRWSWVELQTWLNAAYRVIVTVVPRANSATATMTLAAGIRQVLSGLSGDNPRLIEVVRNMAATSDKSIIKLWEKSDLDKHLPTWPSEAQSVNIQVYCVDERNSREFLVYPPATTAAQVELVYSFLPAPHTLTEAGMAAAYIATSAPGSGDALTAYNELTKIGNEYADPITDLILYRAFSKDSGSPENMTRAVAHYQAAMTALGIGKETAKESQPKG